VAKWRGGPQLKVALDRCRRWYGPLTFTNDTFVGNRSSEVYSRLLKERIVFLGTDVKGSSANLICAQLLLLHPRTPTATFTCT
jgi:hypothetical protein